MRLRLFLCRMFMDVSLLGSFPPVGWAGGLTVEGRFPERELGSPSADALP